MSREAGRYTEREFALILAKATELAARPDAPGRRDQGLTLDEMKSIAAEAGLDPQLLERAARLVPRETGSSVADRLFGGSFNARAVLDVPIPFTREAAEHMLTAARSAVHAHGEGEASAAGMSLAASTDGTVFVSAHEDGTGTRVRVAVDNRSRLVTPLLVGGLGTFFVTLGAMTIGSNAPPGATLLPYVVLAGGWSAAAAWTVISLRKVARSTAQTVDDLLATLSRTLERSASAPEVDGRD